MNNVYMLKMSGLLIPGAALGGGIGYAMAPDEGKSEGALRGALQGVGGTAGAGLGAAAGGSVGTALASRLNPHSENARLLAMALILGSAGTGALGGGIAGAGMTTAMLGRPGYESKKNKQESVEEQPNTDAAQELEEEG